MCILSRAVTALIAAALAKTVLVVMALSMRVLIPAALNTVACCFGCDNKVGHDNASLIAR